MSTVNDGGIQVNRHLADLLDEIGYSGVIAQIVAWLTEDDRGYSLENALSRIAMTKEEFAIEVREQTS
jgi:hypothetical protein